MSVTTQGLQLNVRQKAVKTAVELLSSMRFAIALLVVLAIASIIGTVLTQEDPYPNYVNQFGPFWADMSADSAGDAAKAATLANTSFCIVSRLD